MKQGVKSGKSPRPSGWCEKWQKSTDRWFEMIRGGLQRNEYKPRQNWHLNKNLASYLYRGEWINKASDDV